MQGLNGSTHESRHEHVYVQSQKTVSPAKPFEPSDSLLPIKKQTCEADLSTFSEGQSNRPLTPEKHTLCPAEASGLSPSPTPGQPLGPVRPNRTSGVWVTRQRAAPITQGAHILPFLLFRFSLSKRRKCQVLTNIQKGFVNGYHFVSIFIIKKVILIWLPKY